MTLNEIGEKELSQQQAEESGDNLSHLLTPTLDESWFKSALRNFKETLNPPKLPPLELTSRPIEFHTSAEEMEIPWYKSLVEGVRDTISPRKLPPLEVTSKSVEVPDIWSSNAKQGSLSFATAIGLEVIAVVLLFLLFTNKEIQKAIKEHVTLIAPDLGQYKPKLPPKLEKAGGGGGGGMKNPEPVSKGTTPKFAPKQFMPPTQVTTPKPELPVAPTITAEAPKIDMDQYGDPNAKNLPFSGGPGTGGLGSGHGGGIGNGDGNGFGNGRGGGMGSGVYRIGGSVSAPAILMKVEPEYSEEARKAKFQGTVVLMIVVDEKGMPRNIRVVRPLGLGLDEKAIEAVQRWRFKPGMKDGHAVATEATVEVNFRLL